MRSHRVRWTPSNDWCPQQKRKHRDTGDEGHRHVEVETGVMQSEPRNATECGGLDAGGVARRASSPGPLRGAELQENAPH